MSCSRKRVFEVISGDQLEEYQKCNKFARFIEIDPNTQGLELEAIGVLTNLSDVPCTPDNSQNSQIGCDTDQEDLEDLVKNYCAEDNTFPLPAMLKPCEDYIQANRPGSNLDVTANVSSDLPALDKSAPDTQGQTEGEPGEEAENSAVEAVTGNTDEKTVNVESRDSKCQRLCKQIQDYMRSEGCAEIRCDTPGVSDTDGKPRCVKGKRCGRACIPKYNKCHKL